MNARVAIAAIGTKSFPPNQEGNPHVFPSTATTFEASTKGSIPSRATALSATVRPVGACCKEEKCQPRVGRVLDVYWTMCGQQSGQSVCVLDDGLVNSRSNRSEQSPALEVKQRVSDLGNARDVLLGKENANRDE